MANNNSLCFRFFLTKIMIKLKLDIFPSFI